MTTATHKQARRKRKPRKPVEYATAFAEDATAIPTIQLARTTRKSALAAWRSWVRFCESPDIQLSSRPNDLLTVSLQDLRKFLHWHVNHSEITKLQALFVFARQWRQAYKILTGKSLDLALGSEMKTYIQNDLRIEFDLQEERSDKPVLDVNDLLVTLHFHWVSCTEWYASERQRVQLALMLLLICYTSARPSALIVCEQRMVPENLDEDEQPFLGQYTSYEPGGDCLKYKDVKIYKVRGGEGRHVFIMIITLRLMKGVRNKSLAVKYTFHERDDNLAFCPILHVLALAFADKAFSSPFIQEPEDLYTFEVDDSRGLEAVPIEWRSDMLERPIFRTSTEGVEAWTYEEARFPNARLGKAVGFKDAFRFYQGRRGAGEAFNARTSVAVRNRAMGHSRAEIFDKYYTNQTVAADTQSAFLGTPSQDWMIGLSSHLSLTRDPNAQQLVPKPTKSEIESDPDIATLRTEIEELEAQVSSKHGKRRPKMDPLCAALNCNKRKLKALQKKVSDRLYKRQWELHFATLGATEIARQRTGHGLPCGTEQQPQFEFEERRVLSTLLCRNDDIREVEEKLVTQRRLQALKSMAKLCHRRQAPHQRQTHSAEPDEQEESAHFDPDQLHGNQCPWCLHDDSLSYHQRRYAYSQVSKLRNHVESTHFAKQTGMSATVDPASLVRQQSGDYRCPFSYCGQEFQRDDHLKNHLAVGHDFFCAPRSQLSSIDNTWTDMIVW